MNLKKKFPYQFNGKYSNHITSIIIKQYKKGQKQLDFHNNWKVSKIFYII